MQLVQTSLADLLSCLVTSDEGSGGSCTAELVNFSGRLVIASEAVKMLEKANHALARLSGPMTTFGSGSGMTIAGPVACLRSTSPHKRTVRKTRSRPSTTSAPSSFKHSPNHLDPSSSFNRLHTSQHILTFTSNRLLPLQFPPTTKLPLTHRRAMSSNPVDIQARQQTLEVLGSIGLDLEWNAQYELAIPKGCDQVEKIDNQTTQFVKKLVSEAQSVAFESLVSSLLAGPDNESDEPVDVPVVLGKPAGVMEDVKKLQDWVLETLGIPPSQSLTVREQLVIPPKDSSTTSLSASSLPYVLARLSRAKAFQTESKDSSESDSQFESLKTALDQLQPRWSFEVEVQSKVVCALVGRPIELGGEWVGLISYRVIT